MIKIAEVKRGTGNRKMMLKELRKIKQKSDVLQYIAFARENAETPYYLIFVLNEGGATSSTASIPS